MASQRVKGISIEIDGNTTPLQKALDEVDKSLSTTQKSLKDVEKLLKFDPKNTELLAQKQQLLKKAVIDTKERLKELKEAQKQMDENGVDKNSEQYQALQREIIATEQQLKKAEAAQDAFNKEMSEGAEEATKQKMSLKELGDMAQTVSDKTRALSTGAAAVGTAFLGMAYKAGTTADDLLTLSRNTGFSVEELQKMQYASDIVDVSMDQMTGSLQKLVKQMGSGNKAFETLGVSITDENGNMRDAVDVWYDSLEALSHVENATERDQIAMELFGKSAMDLSGIVDDGGEALKALGQEAEDMGLILGEDAVSNAAKFNDELDKLKNQATQAFFEAGASLSDTLLPLLGDLIDKVSEVIQWFSDLDGDTQLLILTILGLVAAISPVAGLISSVVTVVGGLSAAFTFFLSPAGLVIAIIGALIAAGIAIMQNWDSVKAKLAELGNWFKTTWTNIYSTVSGVINNIASVVSDKWNNIKQTISNAINGAKDAVSSAINAIKGLFNFHVSWPHIPLPHFSVSGSANPLDWLKNGVPKISIEWYAKAMDNGLILNSPTIFGMQNGRLLGAGEAGAEVVVGANSLYAMIKSAVGSPSVPLTVNVTVNGNVDDSDRFARALGDRLANIIERNSEVFR